MPPCKNILIFLLTALRLLHGSEPEKLSSAVFSDPSMEILAGSDAAASALSAPGAKKKVRINSSSNERKTKLKPSVCVLKNEKFRFDAVLANCAIDSSLFKNKIACRLDSSSLLHLFHLF